LLNISNKLIDFQQQIYKKFPKMGQNIIDFVPKMGQDASDFVLKMGQATLILLQKWVKTEFI
ncbi:hypothetical protein F3F50_12635, partial [Bacteroides ovatus]